ncbi:MAG: hypothetical protein KA004_01745 [Verrucomicrobiales bacterium]|nr:hypothetical protein [Verrucomicrobiales bacterium]
MNTEATITCPNCHGTIPPTTAVTHGIREPLANEYAQRQRKLEQDVAARGKKLASEKESLENARTELDAQVSERMRLEKQLVRVLGGTATLYGELQGIVGSATLPGIPVLELTAPEDGSAEELVALQEEPEDKEHIQL